MKIGVAMFAPHGSPIAVALVDSSYTASAEMGDPLIERIQRHFPTRPVMLVSIDENGYGAHAQFQTSTLLALIQLEVLNFSEVDLGLPPHVEDDELPF
jgi:hypothetical protein